MATESVEKPDPILQVKDLSKSFGGLHAVDQCSLEIGRGRITGLIGPNGAGKSTLFNLVAGALTPDKGQILLDGEEVAGLAAHELFERGLLRTFQIAHEFANLAAVENLMVVPPTQTGESLIRALIHPQRVASDERKVRQRAEEVIDFLQLGDVWDQPAGQLSGGQKKLLELGRTMMADAKLVLLDEVGAGVNKTLLQRLIDNIRRMNTELGYTFFIVEHDMDLIGALCDPVIVMANGSVIAEGHLSDLRQDAKIVEAYFGKPVDRSK